MPVDEVARAILAERDENGHALFELIGYNKGPGPLPVVVSLDLPETLTGDEYAVAYTYHSSNCSITDPADPRYRNSNAVIVDLNRNWSRPEETEVRWRWNHLRNEHMAPGYDHLERLLRGL